MIRRSFFFVLMLVSISCGVRPKGEHYEFDFVNNSDSDVRVVRKGRAVDDTLFLWSGFWVFPEQYQVASFSSKHFILEWKNTFETIFKYNPYLSVFVYRGTSVKDGKELARYDLTFGDLFSLNWTIAFPPDERMRHIRMWPTYDSYSSYSP